MQLLSRVPLFLGVVAPLTLLLSPASATPLPAPIFKPSSDHIHPRLYPSDVCTTNISSIPHLWSVEVHNITYSIPSESPDETVPGTAVFSVTNTLTNSTNKIGCALRFDSLCEIKVEPNGGTSDGESESVLDIHLQVLIEVAYVTVVQNVTCSAATGGVMTVSVGGMAEVYLGCDYESTPKQCWGEEGGWVDAEVLGEVPGGGTGG